MLGTRKRLVNTMDCENVLISSSGEGSPALNCCPLLDSAGFPPCSRAKSRRAYEILTLKRVGEAREIELNPLKGQRDQKKSRGLGVSPSAKLQRHGVVERGWTWQWTSWLCETSGNDISCRTPFSHL